MGGRVAAVLKLLRVVEVALRSSFGTVVVAHLVDWRSTEGLLLLLLLLLLLQQLLLLLLLLLLLQLQLQLQLQLLLLLLQLQLQCPEVVGESPGGWNF